MFKLKTKLMRLLFPYSSIEAGKLYILLAISKAVHFVVMAYILMECIVMGIQFFATLLFKPENFSLISMLVTVIQLSIVLSIPLIIAYIVAKLVKIFNEIKRPIF